MNTKMKFLACLSFILLLTSLNNGFCQDSTLFKNYFKATNAGTDFWFTVPPTYSTSTTSIKVIILSYDTTSVIVQCGAGSYYSTFKTIPYQVIELNLIEDIIQPYLNYATNNCVPEQVLTNFGIHVSSDKPIVIYVMLRGDEGESFLPLPTHVLGSKYIVSSYMTDPLVESKINKVCPDYVGIVACYDQTSVKFTMGGNDSSKTYSGMSSGSYTTKLLSKGDVFFLSTKAKGEDLSGSIIESTKPVAVIYKSYLTNIPDSNQYPNTLIEMGLPIESWGNNYVVPQIINRKHPSIIRIYSQQKNNNIYRDGVKIGSIATVGGLLSNSSIEMRIVPITETPRSAIISGDFPIGVTLFNTGSAEESNTLTTNTFRPFQMNLLPTDLFQNDIIFSLPVSATMGYYEKYYATLVFQNDSADIIPDDFQIGIYNNYQFVWNKLSTYFSSSNGERLNYQLNGKHYAIRTFRLYGKTPYRIYSNKSHPFTLYLNSTPNDTTGNNHYYSFGHQATAMIKDLTKNDTLPPSFSYTLDCYGAIGNGKATDMPSDGKTRSNIGLIYVNQDSTYNYTFSNTDFISGSTYSVDWYANVTDNTKDARLYVTFADRNGNDTTMIVNYYVYNVKINSNNIDFGYIKNNTEIDSSFWIVNNHKQATITVDSIYLSNLNNGFSFINLPAFPFTIKPNDSLKVNFKFNSTSEGTFANQVTTLLACNKFYYTDLNAIVSTSNISVPDITFEDTNIGKYNTIKSKIINNGKIDLYIYSFTKPKDSVFTIDLADIPDGQPIIIKPNGAFISFSVTFKPAEGKQYLDSMIFTTNANKTDSILILNGKGLTNSSVYESNDANNIYIYPQPVNDLLTIKFDNTNSNIIKINISDIYGNFIIPLDYQIISSDKIILNTKSLLSGAYSLTINWGNKIYHQKFIVIH